MAADKDEEIKTAKGLKKKTSEVQVTDNSGNVFKGFQIWTDMAPAVKAAPDIMFAKCVVQPGSVKEKLLCIQIEPPGNQDVFEIPQSNAWNCNSQIDPMTYGDIGMLPHSNVPCVLDFLRHRYMNNQIYTTADPLVVAINPFKDLGNTSSSWIEKYRDASDHTKLAPHVFYTSRVALDNLHSIKKSQTIIVSGESGAGKTEATKQMMRYFAAAKGGTMDLTIQQAIMAANPVLEAFGNAKTIRNNNSSRFGRFMQLEVGKGGGIKYGFVLAFLLEKSRVLTQDESERSYHIFYQMCKGMPAELRKKYRVRDLAEYKYINPKCHTAPGIDDKEEYEQVTQSFKSMKIKAEDVDCIWELVSGVLLLGNVVVTGKQEAGVHDAACIEGEAQNIFEEACNLLKIDPVETKNELIIKTTYAGNNRIEGRWSQEDGDMLKSSLAKAIYEKLFMYIIKELNKNIGPPNGFECFMGMLDIFGFEVFKNNSLEQLFINITNEMLQKNFVDIVFERESRLYREEGVSTAVLQYTSNAHVIECLTAKGASVLSTLEDQCLAPGGADEKLVGSCKNNLKNNPAFQPARVGPNVNFLVIHTIGAIQYNSEGFLYKNKDVLRSELMEIVKKSPSKVTQQLFEGIVMERGKIAKGQLIGSQFLLQLQSLMELINSTEPHFVRCIKPNDSKKALDWVASKVLIQLHALSVLEALQLRQLGYSYRRPFNEFLFQFKFVDLGITENASMEGSAASRKLLETCEIPKDSWAIGKTQVFLKQQAAKDLTKIQRQRLASWGPAVLFIEACMLRLRKKQEIEKKCAKLVRIQAHIRRKIVDRNVTVHGKGGWF